MKTLMLSMHTVSSSYVSSNYREGYKSLVVNPPYSVAKKLYDWFGWRTLRESDITFELVDYNQDQIRRWSPYSNFR